MRHTPVIVTRSRHAAGRLSGSPFAAGQGLFSPSRSGRYYGGLWFKVFSERGPC